MRLDDGNSLFLLLFLSSSSSSSFYSTFRVWFSNDTQTHTHTRQQQKKIEHTLLWLLCSRIGHIGQILDIFIKICRCFVRKWVTIDICVCTELWMSKCWLHSICILAIDSKQSLFSLFRFVLFRFTWISIWPYYRLVATAPNSMQF